MFPFRTTADSDCRSDLCEFKVIYSPKPFRLATRNLVRNSRRNSTNDSMATCVKVTRRHLRDSIVHQCIFSAEKVCRGIRRIPARRVKLEDNGGPSLEKIRLFCSPNFKCVLTSCIKVRHLKYSFIFDHSCDFLSAARNRWQLRSAPVEFANYRNNLFVKRWRC